jgi:hypothetical protein
MAAAFPDLDGYATPYTNFDVCSTVGVWIPFLKPSILQLCGVNLAEPENQRKTLHPSQASFSSPAQLPLPSRSDLAVAHLSSTADRPSDRFLLDNLRSSQ